MQRILLYGHRFFQETIKNTDMILNPFDITKAVDFSDEDINKYWTNISGKEGFMGLLKPWSLMPIIIKGSKGSGKTHIMRYFSYELQKIRYKESLKEGLEKDRFVGIYIRCSGFNANKFSGKGVDDGRWEIIYQSFWEFWIGERVCHYLVDLKKEKIISETEEGSVVRLIVDLLPCGKEWKVNSLEDLCGLFKELQKKIDYEIQNFLFRKDKNLYFDFLISSPTLTYGIPEILHKNISFFHNKYVLYLIDELENFSEKQQELIQLMIREKPTSCTVRIGTRPYGIRTHYILDAIEENRIGSEFELIILDEFLRESDNYKNYLKDICNKRLENLGIKDINNITDVLENTTTDEILELIGKKYPKKAKGYFSNLSRRLKKVNFGNAEIERITEYLSYPEDLVIERTNVLLFYRRWSKGQSKDLISIARDIMEEAKEYAVTKSNEMAHGKILDKFRVDMIDAVCKECNEPLPYWGIDRLILLSCGTPRILLNILKHAFIHETFSKGLTPFENGRIISIDSQMVGIRKTIEWFYHENRIPSAACQRMTDSVTRIGDYLQSLRFSDMPPQCSINIFSIRQGALNDSAKQLFDTLINYSYIIKVEDRKVKHTLNNGDVYQINTAIIPRWELAMGKRGLVQLDDVLANSIFDLEQKDTYGKIVKEKLRRYNAPFMVDSIQTLKFSEEE